MADFLIKTLLECNQPIPDFFQERAPEDAANLDFEDDSGAEEEEEAVGTNSAGDAWGSAEGDAWGGGDAAPAAEAPVTEAGWGGDAGGAW